jgi:hypothetical protein
MTGKLVMTSAQQRILDAGCAVAPDQQRGALADGRSWPAINALKRAGLVAVDYVGHGGGGRDNIWYRATALGRAFGRKAP